MVTGNLFSCCHQSRVTAVAGDLTIALAGNPNAGKSTIFNALTGAHQHVGNWPGKTVGKKEGTFRYGSLTCKVVDLPGAYSLSAYSPEEIITRDYIIHEHPDIVINVVDASNLERNLYLTVQLLEIGCPLILALNVMDIARARGIRIDQARLSALLGHIPVVETVGNRSTGLDNLLEAMMRLPAARQCYQHQIEAWPMSMIHQPCPSQPDDLAPALWSGQAQPALTIALKGSDKSVAHGLNYGPGVEAEIVHLAGLIQAQPLLATQYSPRWLAVKLLEAETDIAVQVQRLKGGSTLIAQAGQGAARLSAAYGDDADIAIADARYSFVNSLVRRVLDTSQAEVYTLTDRIDRIVTNRILGLPIFLALMYLVFKLVVNVSTPFLDWIDFTLRGPVTRWTGYLLGLVSAPVWLQSLVMDGVIPGVGGILVFLPGLFVLYFFLTLLEDSGYMARAAFVMDRVMSFLGLHGKSFIPLILGFGCNVPAIYATRTLENRRDRIVTGLLVPLMSCSARLPIYVVFGLAFFPRRADILIVTMYMMGLVLAALVGWVLTRLWQNQGEAAFVLELPPYRLPTWRNLLLHTWEKSKEFIQKAGTVILAVSVCLWLLMNLPWGVQTQRDSYFGQVSAAIAPLFAPAGFGTWEASGALISGFVAKELVVSTMSQTYLGNPQPEEIVSPASFGQDVAEILTGLGRAALDSGKTLLSLIPGVNLVQEAAASEDTALTTALQSAFNPLAGVAFIIFVLIYTPCVATLSAIKAEYGWRWMWTSAVYQLALAWLLAVLVYQGGQLLGWG